MRTRQTTIVKVFLMGLASLMLPSCGWYRRPVKDEPAWIRDNPKLGVEALPRDMKTGTLYPTHSYNAFKGMDIHVSEVYGHHFSDDEVKGRNSWVMWSGGNQEFWDYLARHSNGIVDLLKLCDSRFIRRNDRFRIMGLVPHPGMDETDPNAKLGKPSQSNHYGLYLDRYGAYQGERGAYVEGPPPDPKVYGFASGIVGLRLFPRAEDPDPRVRAEWEQNRHKWDPKRYVTDEAYYKDPGLVRPYRVGMSCGFCHISANPMNPPTKMASATWSNLSSNIGNQYFWFGRIFGADFKRDNALYHLLNYPEPGTLDTSLVATDGNNNPNTMNSVFQLIPRILLSLKSPREKLPAESLDYMPRLDQGFDVDPGEIVSHVPSGANDVKPIRFHDDEQPFLAYLGLTDKQTGQALDRLPALGDTSSRHTPKILAGGADSIGARGALCRVYLNIGQYSDQWRRIQNTMVGIVGQNPFLMRMAHENSVNWNVTMRRSTNMAKYFLASSVPMHLEDAIQLEYERLEQETADEADDQYQRQQPRSPPKYATTTYVKPNHHEDVVRGARIFARDCFVCHSSISPWELEGVAKSETEKALNAAKAQGFWRDAANWKKWVRQDDYVETAADWLEQTLLQPVDPTRRDGDPFFEKFVKTNYLSTDARYHVSDIGTNSARSLADNASQPNRNWASFSSKEFKEQNREPTPIQIAHPYDASRSVSWQLNIDAGPGRYRPQSLSSMWAHAPYLHNNSVGYYPYEYIPDPRLGHEGEVLSTFSKGVHSVDWRVKIFDDSARRLLGLESKPDKNATTYRKFTSAARRGFDSIKRFEADSVLTLPAVVVPDFIYMQSMAFLGFGIPRWVQVIFLAALLLFGFVLLLKGVGRLRDGEGTLLRNVAGLLIGAVLILAIVAIWRKKEYRIGHIPKGTPVNLVANINGPKWTTSTRQRKSLLAMALIGFKKAEKYNVRSLEDERLTVNGRPLVEILIALSKCPDLVIDKGHEFGQYNTVELAKGRKVEVPVEDREALIEFLKKL